MKNQTKSATAPAAGKRESKLKVRKQKPGKAGTKAAKPTELKEIAAPVTEQREGKGATILRLIAREQGATLPELLEATGWLRHSVRGFLSTAGKTRTITSTKSDSGERIYTLAS